MKKMITSVLALAVVIGVVSIISLRDDATAANANEWIAGNIIDDAVFTNSNAMSAAEIQQFLNNKVGVGQANSTKGQCDTNGAAMSEFGGGTRAQYGMKYGTPAPFTCLKDYYEVPKTVPGLGLPASNYGGKAVPAGAKSAAQIIYDAARQYSINPKVLLVLMQKESVGPIISDAWPTQSQYTYVMGARCPDTAKCDQNYAGFSIQVFESARLLRSYIDGMSQPWWGCSSAGKKVQCSYNARNGSDPGGGYKVPDVSNFILWNPNKGCGGNDITLQSRGTTALYTYTPYQPNKAALDNMYGSGDGCSAYGNRNFWRMFNDWFGDTRSFTTPSELVGRYDQLGGASGPLGIPVADAFCSVGRGTCWQEFKNGFIVYSAGTGSWESKGSIREYWGKVGFQGGKMGYPVDKEVYAGNGLWWQEYQNGFIIGSDKTGYWESMGEIRERWGKLGYQSSTIGLPIDKEVTNKDGSGWQEFQNGFMIKPNGVGSGVWESKGAIRAYWQSIGFQGGKAGWPAGSESYNPTTKLWSQKYQKGSIYYSDAAGGSFISDAPVL